MFDEDEDDGDLDSYEAQGPQEDDLVTEDHVHFNHYRGGHALTIQAREPPSYVGERGVRTHDADPGEVSDTIMWRQLDAYMKRTKFSPNVWFISDHGNAHLMSKPKREKRQSMRARLRHQAAIAQAERKYGTGGSLISGGFYSHWPEHVKNKIRKLARAK